MPIVIALAMAISFQASAKAIDIHFPPGKTVTVVRGSVAPTRPAVYVLQGTKGKHFDLRFVRNTASAVFSATAPGGEPVPEQEYDGVTRLAGVFRATGAYEIRVTVVESDPREAKYALRVGVR